MIACDRQYILLTMQSMPRVRVLLDTCVVRGLVHRTDPCLDIDAAEANLENLAITISDTSVVELTSQLHDERISFSEWKHGIALIDRIRDREWPVLPSGSERAMFCGLCTPDEQALAAAQKHCLAIWKCLAGIDEDTKMNHSVVYDDGNGATIIRTDPSTTSAVKTAARYSWILFVQGFIDKLGGHRPTLDEVREELLAGAEHVDKSIPDLPSRIDLFVKAIAQMVHMATTGDRSYKPSSTNRRGDVFDIMLLMSLGTPLVVVTSDIRFINRIRQIDSEQVRQVISVEEFNNHLAEGSLASCLPHITT